MSGKFSKIEFGAGLVVTDLGDGVIRVDAVDSGDGAGGVPSGGAAGQVLTKDTSTDYDTSWQTPGGIRFDTEPQQGGFLFVKATDVGTSWSDESIEFEARDGAIRQTARGIFIQAGVGIAGGDSVLSMDDAGHAQLSAENELALVVGTGASIVIVGIPTSNPGGSGRLWNDGGTLRIT